MGVTDLVNKDKNPNGNGGGNGGGGNGMPMNPFAPQPINAEDFMTNMNKTVNLHTHTLFRDAVLLQMESVLIGDDKPNPFLVGPAGTGKTAIAEELARWIESKDYRVPPCLQGYTVWSLQISDIISGSGIVGELEEKVQAIVDYLSNKKNKAIVFIDEMHLLYADREGKKIAQILKPALSRGKIKVIGATTTQESREIDNDPAFNRRFTRIIVDELSKEQTVEVLMRYYDKLQKHYGNFKFNTNLAKFIVNEADNFCSSGSHRPDNALTLFDRAVADAVITHNMNLKGSNAQLQALAQAIGISINETSIHETAYKLVTGNNEPKKFNKNELINDLAYIKGQDDIVKELIRIIQLHDLHARPTNKPLTMLFAGASGVGKTEITKAIAKSYRGIKPIILNMTEYTGRESINRIIGAPAGYVGYDSNAELPFDALESNPHQIILLDEFEKCHSDVQGLFMSAFDEGYIKTSRGKTVDFSKSIIIATTNAGCTTRQEKCGFINTGEGKASMKNLSEFFKPELLNRFEYRFEFNPITRDVYKEIMAETYAKDVAEIKANMGTRVPLADNLDDTTLEELVTDSFDPLRGARQIKTKVKRYVDDILCDYQEQLAAKYAANSAPVVTNSNTTDDTEDVAEDTSENVSEDTVNN